MNNLDAGWLEGEHRIEVWFEFETYQFINSFGKCNIFIYLLIYVLVSHTQLKICASYDNIKSHFFATHMKGHIYYLAFNL